MKIKVQFEDEEYIHLAKEFTKLGLDLTFCSETIEKYPIKFVVDSDTMTLALHIINQNLTTEVIDNVVSMLKDYIGTGTIQDLCISRFGEFFEMQTIEIPLIAS